MKILFRFFSPPHPSTLGTTPQCLASNLRAASCFLCVLTSALVWVAGWDFYFTSCHSMLPYTQSLFAGVASIPLARYQPPAKKLRSHQRNPMLSFPSIEPRSILQQIRASSELYREFLFFGLKHVQADNLAAKKNLENITGQKLQTGNYISRAKLQHFMINGSYNWNILVFRTRIA